MTARNLILVAGRTKGQRRVMLGFKAAVKPVPVPVRRPQQPWVRADIGRRTAARGGRR